MKLKIILFLGVLLPALVFGQGSLQNMVIIKRLIENKDYNQAISRATEMLTYEENKELYLLRAKAYHGIRDYKHEIEDLKKALDFEEKATTRLSLALAYQAVKDTVEANRMLKLNLELYPDHVPTIISTAALASYKRQHEQALKILTDAYRTYDSPLLLQARAVEYNKQGKYDKALADYETLIYSRKSSSYYMSAAHCAAKAGNSKKAIEYYTEYLQLNPNSSTALNNVGNQLRKMGKFKDAEVYYKKAIDVSPRNIYPLAGQTLIAYMQGDVDKAFSIAESALLFNTKSKLADLARGTLNFFEGDLIGAESDFKQVLQDPQQVENVYTALANVYIYKGEYARAIDFASTYMEKQKVPSPAAYNARGFAFYKMGKKEEAIKDFLYSMELEEDYQPVFRYFNQDSKQLAENYIHVQFFSPFNNVNDCQSGFFMDGKKDLDFKVRIISNGEIDASKINLYESGNLVNPKSWSLKTVEKRDFKFMGMVVTDVLLGYTPNVKKSYLKLSYDGWDTQTLTLIR